MDYQSHGEIWATYPWWTNVITQVGREMAHERVVAEGSEGGGRNRSVPPEQNSVSWMKDLVA